MLRLWGMMSPSSRGLVLGVTLALLMQLTLRGIKQTLHAVRVGAAVPALTGKVVVIDPGHGGKDPGSIGVSGTREKEITLAVALHLRSLLLDAGANPVLTRSVDIDLMHLAQPGPDRARRRELLARVDMAIEHRADVFVSVHANAFGRNTRWQGAQVFWDPRGVPGGEQLAHLIQEELVQNKLTQRVHRPIEQYVLQNAPVPAVTVEVGFLSNAAEEKLLGNPEHQQKLACAIIAGVARFLAGHPGAQAFR